MKYLFIFGLTVLLLHTPNKTEAISTMAEQRLSEQLRSVVTKGKIVEIGENKEKFTAIFSLAKKEKSQWGIVILHDLESHADWQEVISPLRNHLPRFGWHTLSIQLPVGMPLKPSSELKSLETEIHRRIQAAIEFCRSKQIHNIVLLGHQFGAVMAASFIASKDNTDNPVEAFVALNLYTPAISGVNAHVTNSVEKIKIALLDILPMRSSDHVLSIATQRKALMQRLNHDKYKQIPIIGTDYTFTGAETTLVTRIQGWLKKLAPSVETQSPTAKLEATTTSSNKSALTQ